MIMNELQKVLKELADEHDRHAEWHYEQARKIKSLAEQVFCEGVVRGTKRPEWHGASR